MFKAYSKGLANEFGGQQQIKEPKSNTKW